ncbi:hypothetical protein [Halohasta litorea]|uniref:Winged helix-turn-helix transcriptional regulator n=1 Tax=Halohasta litorea TaxID=869891 RepID=A0ABD6DCW3_9EURY|nr:hypothetical protein [Halohasta litorea]
MVDDFASSEYFNEFDIGQYPDKTEEILVALWPEGPRRHWLKLKEIADQTNLSKDQVRYRMDMLVDDGHVEYNEHLEDNGVHYQLSKGSIPAMRPIVLSVDLTGEVPEEPTKKDFMKVINHIENLESELNDLREETNAKLAGLKKDIQAIESLNGDD